MVFARIDLTGREFDEDLAIRVAELAFQQDAPIRQQRQDDDGAGVADEFAVAFLAIRQADTVAFDLQEGSIVDDAAVEAGFFQFRHYVLLIVEAAIRSIISEPPDLYLRGLCKYRMTKPGNASTRNRHPVTA